MELQITLHKLLGNTKIRLKNKHKWNDEFVISAINEYAKFLQLHMMYPDVNLVPGKVIDYVWHDHILHTSEYIDFCDQYFKHYLHHHPKDLTSDADADADKNNDDSAETHALYEKTYGHVPPSSFWKTSTPAPTPAPNVRSIPACNQATYDTGFDCRCSA